MSEKLGLGRTLRVKGEVMKVNGIFFDDDGGLTSIAGQLVEPRPDGTVHVAIDMRGCEMPEAEWLH